METKQYRPAIRTKLWLIAALMVIATVLFVIGVAIERSGGHQEAGEGQSAEVGEAQHSEETNTSHSEEAGEAHVEGTGEVHSEESGEVHTETTFGLDLESPWLVGAAALVSLALVGALLYIGHPVLMAIIPLNVMMMFLDVVEVIRQVGESNTGIAAIATIIALLRLVIIVLAILALREGRMSLLQAGAGSSQSAT